MSFQYMTITQRLALLDSAAELSAEGRKQLNMAQHHFLLAQHDQLECQRYTQTRTLCTFAALRIAESKRCSQRAGVFLRMSDDLIRRAS